LNEVGYYIHVVARLGYIGQAQVTSLETAVRGTAAPLIGLIRQQLKKQAASRK
jgi:hypothetical protein